MKKKKPYFLFLLCLIPYLMIGQTEGRGVQEAQYQQENINERPFDEKKWEDLTKDLDYSETAPQKKKKTNERTQNGTEGDEYARERREPFSLAQGSWIMKLLIILLAIVVVVLLLRGLMGSDLKVKNKKIKKGNPIDIEQIEEDIENADLPDFIRQALENEQYALAIRLYYLAALKELAIQKDIVWKKDKTNLDYLQEMRRSTHFAAFQKLTTIFERVWYGDRLLDREGFEQLEPGFKQFINHLKAEELVQ